MHLIYCKCKSYIQNKLSLRQSNIFRYRSIYSTNLILLIMFNYISECSLGSKYYSNSRSYLFSRENEFLYIVHDWTTAFREKQSFFTTNNDENNGSLINISFASLLSYLQRRPTKELRTSPLQLNYC